jgi:hypothetical protein
MDTRKISLAAVAALSLALGWAAPAQATLVAAYHFNETAGTSTAPSVGSVSGTLLNGASFVAAGIQGGAVSLSRGSPGGLVSFGPNLFPAGAFSVQVWVQTTDTQSSIPIAFHTSTVVAGYLVGINNINDGCGTPTGRASFYVAYPCSGSGPVVVNDGAWHQLVGVYDGNRTAIYVDGQLQSMSGGGNPLNTPPAGTSFLLGGVMVGSTPTNIYSGLLSDVLLFDNALSAGDVLTLYTSAVPEPAAAALWSAGLLALLGVRGQRCGGRGGRGMGRRLS